MLDYPVSSASFSGAAADLDISTVSTATATNNESAIGGSTAATGATGTGGESSAVDANAKSQIPTPMSLALAPTTTISAGLDNVVSGMSPLAIGMEGLTEQQAAEVVELLTPFLSPAGTPSFNAATAAHGFLSHPATPLVLGQAMAEGDSGSHYQQQQQFGAAVGNAASVGSGRAGADESRTFSPLTSPALLPQQAAGAKAGVGGNGNLTVDPHKTQHQLSLSFQHSSAASTGASSHQFQQQSAQFGFNAGGVAGQRQQQGATGMDASASLSMPPPSPSITAEHIMRRQQQMLFEKHAAASSSVASTTTRVQQSPSFPSSSSSSVASQSTHIAVSTNSGSIRSRRNTAASAAIGNSGSSSGATHMTASPHHHPYRMPPGYKKQAAGMVARSPLVNSTQVHGFTATTPVLMSTAAAASGGLQSSAGAHMAATTGADREEFLLDPLPDSALVSAAAAAVAASLHNTPVLQYSAAGNSAALSGLSLPGAMDAASAAGATFGVESQQHQYHQQSRTLHQLNASPHLSSGAYSASNHHQQMQRSVSSAAAAATLAMLSGQGIVASQQPQTPTAVATADSVSQQLNNWLDMNKAASSTQQPQQQSAAAIAHAMQARPSVDMPGSSAMPATATPASLMNLPSSAHHLPHTSTGEIVTSDATSSVAIATVFGQQQQHQQQQTTSTGQPFLSSTAVSAPTSASAAAAAAVAAMIATTSVAGTPATLAGSASGTMHQQFDTSNSTSSIPIMTPLLQFATQSAPMTEFVHPPMPPPLQIGPSLGAGTSERSGGRQGSVTFIKPASVDEPHTDGRKRGRRKSTASATTAAAAQRQAASSSKSANPRSKPDSKRGRRRSRPSLIISPRATPLVPSILKNVTSPGISPLTGPMISPAIAPLTPAIAPLHRRQSNSGERPIAAAATPVLAPSTSGGGGGSTTVTPRMGPKTPIIAATSTTNIVGLEADVVTRLATKSNYQNILEGNSELLGLKYHTEFKSGLEKRRTNHKQAEQKRRDSLKLCFYDLKTRLPDLNPKLVSKIYLLNEANAFIDSQKSLIERQARIIELLSNALIERDVDVAAITAPIIKEEEEEKKRRQEAKEAKEQEAEEERGEQQAEDMDIE